MTRRPFASTLLWTGSFRCISHCVARRCPPRQPSSGARGLCRRGRRPRGALDRSARKREREGGPLAQDRGHGELPGMLLRDLLREGEAEPGTSLLGGEEGIEDAPEALGRNAGPGLADSPVAAPAGVAGADEDGPAAGHRLAGVADEIQEELPQLP